MNNRPSKIAKILLRNRVRPLYKRYNLKISREVRDIIHGYIMSDGYVKKEGNLTVEQSIAQAKFVMWLYNKFEKLRTSKPPTEVTKNRDGTTFSLNKSLRFNTRNLLHGFHYMWYKPIKRLPKNIACFFSPLFISVWYAGDGTKIQTNLGAKFEVTCWTKEERLVLKKLFKQKYNIDVAINRAGQSKTGTEQWTLTINAPDYPKFKALITQYDLIPTLFAYKIY